MFKIGQLINHKIERKKKALKYITSKDYSHGINSKAAYSLKNKAKYIKSVNLMY